jgi:DNA/RNA endonuclease G (NUC1)
MRPTLRGASAVALAALVTACAGDGAQPLAPVAPQRSLAAATAGSVRISEIHYDNAGTDAGEAIEVTGPAGTDLTGWSLVLYNGSGGAPYNTKALAGVLGTSCGTGAAAEGALAFGYPSNGIQNGAPDGVALVNAQGAVVEFLSYEGSFTAVGGPANGMTSTDVGASQNGATSETSLQRNGFGGWAETSPRTFGACNDEPPPPYDGPTTVVINELMGDPLAAESESWGEWFEVHNYGTEAVDLGGWKIRSGGDAEHTIAGGVVVAPGGYAVLGRAADRARNGGVPVDYNYFTGTSTTIWLGTSDWLVLRTPTNATVDSVGWSALPEGATRGLRDASADNANVDGAAWGFATTPYGSGDFGTPGAANGPLADVAPPVPTGVARIVFSGRDASDPALPVGFEDQLFATGYSADRADTVRSGFAWSSATPALASVDEDGVVRALGAGVAVIRATSPDGRVGLYEVATRVAVASATADYQGNTEFGVPADGDASDDVLVERAGFTLSYSPRRNTPNWVSYDLEATHFGPEDRCDCFTADPLVPAAAGGLTTADYTGAGAYHGYGIDRGHLVRSADRTAGSLDNAHTYYFSNIIPQAADQNQGPWSDLEIHLGNLARAGTHEVYVIAGVAGEQGTLKDEGKVVIPARVWKVAVVMPRNRRLGDVGEGGDFELVAVDMPNVAGIRDADWRDYATTVDAIERASGYDLLALLPDHVEWLVEAGLTSPAGAPAPRLLEILAAGVHDLAARGVLAAGEATSLDAKLAAAAARLAAGDVEAAAGMVRAFSLEVQAMMRAGRLSAAQGESLRLVAGWVMDAIG